MAKAYSVDLRLRIVADYDDGVRVVDLAPQYRVSERRIYVLLALYRETGSVVPPPGKKRGPKPVLSPHSEQLVKLNEEQPDATLEELRERLPVDVSIATVWRALRRLKLTLKKSFARCGAATT